MVAVQLGAVLCYILAYSILGSAVRLTEPALNVSVVTRDTHQITVNWEARDPNSTIETYQIIAEDLHNRYRAIYEGSANIDIVKRRSVVRLHQSNTAYNICVVAYLTREAEYYLQVQTVQDCQAASTVPVMLTSSAVALAVVLGFFVCCVALGYATWRVRLCLLSTHRYQHAATTENGGPHRMDNHASTHQTTAIEV